MNALKRLFGKGIESDDETHALDAASGITQYTPPPIVTSELIGCGVPSTNDLREEYFEQYTEPKYDLYSGVYCCPLGITPLYSDAYFDAIRDICKEKSKAMNEAMSDWTLDEQQDLWLHKWKEQQPKDGGRRG